MCNICSYPFHDWNEAESESDESCLQTRTCKICDDDEDLGEVHEWGEPEYEDENPCQLVVRCQRCDYVQEIEEEERHEWNEAQYESDESCWRVNYYNSAQFV